MDRAMSGTLHSTSPRLSCYGDNAVERRSTVSRIGTGRPTLYTLHSTTVYRVEGRDFTPQMTSVLFIHPGQGGVGNAAR